MYPPAFPCRVGPQKRGGRGARLLPYGAERYPSPARVGPRAGGGGLNLLRAFSLYNARILEQALIDLYNPYLNDSNIVAFFNFTLSPTDLLKTKINDVYLVWDALTGALIFTANSIKELALKLGVARSTVKNYLNWTEGLEVDLANEKTLCYIRKQGDEIRTNKIASQLSSKDRFPNVELKGRTLYDLKPPPPLAL